MTTTPLTPTAADIELTRTIGPGRFTRCFGIDGSQLARAAARSAEPPSLTRSVGKSATLRTLASRHRRPITVTRMASADGGSKYAAFAESLGSERIQFPRVDRRINLLTERDI